jgi:PAP2 superfamily protein
MIMQSSRAARRLALGCLLALGAAAASCRGAAPPPEAGLVTSWMRTLYALVRAERLSPPVASRVFAYSAAALYEGIAAGSPELKSLAGQLNGLSALPTPRRDERYDWGVVAVSAETTVVKALFREGFPATQVTIAQLGDSQIAARAARGVSPVVRDRSATFGATLGHAILDWAAGDRFKETRGLTWQPPKGRRYWVNTGEPEQFSSVSLSAVSEGVTLGNPADTLAAGGASERTLVVSRPKSSHVKSLAAVNPTGVTEPYWDRVRPFVLTSMDQCAPPPPLPFSETPGSEFYRQVKAVYDTGRTLTPEQREIALYWADNPGESGTPPGHWVLIASQLVDELHLDADRSAEMFVLTTVALADAFISCWHEKFTYSLVRPVTYIRRVIDPRWHTLIPTPPFPEYTAGHAVQSGAAAGVLTALFGDRPFADSTHVNIGRPVRRFASFRAAADEVARSRLYAGLHYPMSLSRGVAQGECIARRVMERVKTRAQR